jgi:hypothetical protein
VTKAQHRVKYKLKVHGWISKAQKIGGIQSISTLMDFRSTAHGWNTILKYIDGFQKHSTWVEYNLKVH